MFRVDSLFKKAHSHTRSWVDFGRNQPALETVSINGTWRIHGLWDTEKDFKDLGRRLRCFREDQGEFNHFVHVRLTRDRFEYCVVDDSGSVRDAGSFAKGDDRDTPVGRGQCSFGQGR